MSWNFVLIHFELLEEARIYRTYLSKAIFRSENPSSFEGLKSCSVEASRIIKDEWNVLIDRRSFWESDNANEDGKNQADRKVERI